MKSFWHTASCSPVEIYRRFRGAHCLHHHGNCLWNVGILQ